MPHINDLPLAGPIMPTDLMGFGQGPGHSDFRRAAVSSLSGVNGDPSLAQAGAIAYIGLSWTVPVGVDVSITVGTDVATLSAAFTAISRWVIPDSSFVNIILPTGATTYTSSVSFSHPYGHRVRILGATPITTTASSIGTVTGSTGAWSVPLNVASGTNVSVGDYALIRNATGTGSFYLLNGICEVTAVAGAVVTVKNTAKVASWPTMTLTGGAVVFLKSRLVINGVDGLLINGPLGLIDQIALVGNRTAGTVGLLVHRAGAPDGSRSSPNKIHGIVATGNSFGITSFGDGGMYAQYNGTILAMNVCVANCRIYNVLAQHNGAILFDRGVSSGSDETGVAASSGGDVSADGAHAHGNGIYGYFAFQGGSILPQNGFAWRNGSDGLRSAWGGSIRGLTINSQFNLNGFFAVGADMVVASCVGSNNSQAGFYCEGGGSIYASSSTASNNGSFGAYADGGVIDAPNLVASSNGATGCSATNNGTILVPSLSGTGNVTYLCAASRAGFIRATGAATGGATIFADSDGVVDILGATGSPVLSIGQDGVILNTISYRGSMLLPATGTIAIGQTSSAGLNIDRASSAYARFVQSGTLKTIIGTDDGGSLVVGAASGDSVLRAEQALWFTAGGSSERGFIDANGNASLGRANPGTGASNGFFYIPGSPGAPTGIPTAKSGRVPLYADTSGNKIYAYLGGAWQPLN